MKENLIESSNLDQALYELLPATRITVQRTIEMTPLDAHLGRKAKLPVSNICTKPFWFNLNWDKNFNSCLKTEIMRTRDWCQRSNVGVQLYTGKLGSKKEVNGSRTKQETDGSTAFWSVNEGLRLITRLAKGQILSNSPEPGTQDCSGKGSEQSRWRPESGVNMHNNSPSNELNDDVE